MRKVLESCLFTSFGVVTLFIIESSTTFIASIRNGLSQLRSLSLPWILIGLVLAQNIVSLLANASMGTILGPIMTVMYALSGEQSVMALGIQQVAIGLVAIILSSMFFLCKLGKHVSCRVLFAFSNIFVLLGYLFTFPFPFWSSPMQPFNAVARIFNSAIHFFFTETTRSGCNSLEYPLCGTQLAVNIIPFLIIFALSNAFASTSAALSLDTIYSKMIGDIDQNIMQSVYVIAGDLTLIIVPVYASAVFAAAGLNIIYIINGSIFAIATIVWFASWRWLEPYN